MPVTYSLIASNTLSSSAASVTFSSIPNTYTDLVLKWSARSDGDVVNSSIRINATTSNYSETRLTGNGSSVDSGRNTGNTYFLTYGMNPSSSTANTFANAELYIPDYAGSANKPMSLDSASENNATTAFRSVVAELWSNTAAITSISISAFPFGGSNNLVSGSSFFLYGIKKS